MHAEAFTYTRQTLGYPAPTFLGSRSALAGPGEVPHRLGDAVIPGGALFLGSTPEQPFVFDNERWAQSVEVKPFAIARTAITNGEFRAFVEDGGYRRSELWTEEGWWWRNSAGAEHPVYWRPDGGGWLRRNFDRWGPLE